MRRVILVVLLAATVSGCKTAGLIPSKFESGNWSVGEKLSNLMELLAGAELNTAEAGQEWFAERR